MLHLFRTSLVSQMAPSIIWGFVSRECGWWDHTVAEGTAGAWNQVVSSRFSQTLWLQWLIQAVFEHWVVTHSSSLGFLSAPAAERLRFFQTSCLGFCGAPSRSRLWLALNKCRRPTGVSTHLLSALGQAISSPCPTMAPRPTHGLPLEAYRAFSALFST